MLEDPVLAQSLAASARRKIDVQYSAGRMAKEYETLFARLLGRQAPGALSERGV
jgi:hypothetical protein